MKVDLLIKNGTVLTMNPTGLIIEKGFVAIHKGLILEIGNDLNVVKYAADKIIDASNNLVMPGLVNTHTHTGNTIYRGFADDLPLKEWLEKYIFPVEKQFCTAETVRLSAKLSIIEMLKSGITTFSDMYYFEDEVAQVVKESGIRAEVGETLVEFPSPSMKNSTEGLKYAEALIKNWENDPLITIAVTPHAPYTCSRETLVAAKKLADKYSVNYHIHLSETVTEVNYCKEKFGLSPVAYLDSLGILDSNVYIAHGVHLDENDKEILLKKNVALSHNPQSNMKLASGVAPVQDLLNRGLRIALGTDGTASNNNLNLFEEMDMAAKLQKVFTNDPTALNAETVVGMATLEGAKLLKKDKKIGSLEIGKCADLILVDLKLSHLVPLYNIYSHIVYAMNGSEVHTSIVNGKVLMENRKILTIKEDNVIDEILLLQEKIKKEFKF